LVVKNLALRRGGHAPMSPFGYAAVNRRDLSVKCKCMYTAAG